jgi:hypothetical protein
VLLAGTPVIALAVHHERSASRTSKLAVHLVTDPRQIVLPLDRYQPTRDQQASVTRAVALLGARCMRRFGLRPVIDPAQAVPAAVVDIGEQRRYGPLDAAQAARYGFHPPPELTAKLSATPHASGTQLAVWTGRGPKTVAGRPIPTGGCQAQAQQEVAAGAPAVDPTLPMRLADQSWHQSQNHPQVRAAFDTWSRCMAATGFDYAEPMDAVNDPRFSGPRPTTLEIRTATTDVRCMHRANVVGIWLAAETALQNELITQNGKQLALLKQTTTRMIHAAHAINDEHPR